MNEVSNLHLLTFRNVIYLTQSHKVNEASAYIRALKGGKNPN